MTRRSIILLRTLLFALPLAALAGSADGQILINNNKALAGNVTAGDAPGYPALLSSPGSYKLTGNLAPGTNLDGILVTAPDVTIDLNGYRITCGPAGGVNNARNGITTESDRLTIRNGTIGACEGAAIHSDAHSYLIVEDMRIVNGVTGIWAFHNDFTRIINSTIATNQIDGIVCGLSCHIEGNVVSDNGGKGIALESGTILGNTIMTNDDFAISTSVSPSAVGYGNNTIVLNNVGDEQVNGTLIELFPNACNPTPCQ